MEEHKDETPPATVPHDQKKQQPKTSPTSSASQTSSSSNNNNDSTENLTFFDATGVRNLEYWQCIKYIAPTSTTNNNKNRKWKRTDARGVYCLVCRTKITYDSSRNSNGVKRHMAKFHADLLTNYRKKHADDITRRSEKRIRQLQTTVSSLSEVMTSSSPKNNNSNSSSSSNNNAEELSRTTTPPPPPPPPHQPKPKPPSRASELHQLQFQNLVAIWTATSLHPPSISSNPSLQKMIDFASRVDVGSLSLPPPEENAATIATVAETMRGSARREMERQRQQGGFFAVGVEVWSSRRRRWRRRRRDDDNVAVTIFFLTEGFERRRVTLDVIPLTTTAGGGGRDGTEEALVQRHVSDTLRKWKLNPSFLCMVIRDGESNVVNACRDENRSRGGDDIPHVSRLGQSLHWVVGPLLLSNKWSADCEEHQYARGDNYIEDDDDDDDDDDDESEINDYFQDNYNTTYENQTVISDIRSLVEETRQLYYRVIKNNVTPTPPHLQQQLTHDAMTPPTASSSTTPPSKIKTMRRRQRRRTRWSSVLAMLNRMVSLMEPLNEFISFHNSSIPSSGQQQQQQQQQHQKLPLMTQEKWSLLHGLCYLLTSFEKAAVMLNDDDDETQYSSFVSALPVLCKLKAYVGDRRMFDFTGHYSQLTRSKRMYFDLYGREEFFDGVLERLEQCRLLLFEEFERRFRGVIGGDDGGDLSGGDGLLWSSLLDPRFGMRSLHWMDDGERKTKAKESLVEEVKRVVREHIMARKKQEQMQSNNGVGEMSSMGGGVRSLLSSPPIQNFGDDDFMFDLHQNSTEPLTKLEDGSSGTTMKQDDFLSNGTPQDATTATSIMASSSSQSIPPQILPMTTTKTTTEELLPTIDDETTLNDAIQKDVNSYLTQINTRCQGRLNPLSWWRENRHTYPYVAMAARKWFSVMGTPTTSPARVLKICNVLDGVKRGGGGDGMVPDVIDHEVFIYNNHEGGFDSK